MAQVLEHHEHETQISLIIMIEYLHSLQLLTGSKPVSVGDSTSGVELCYRDLQVGASWRMNFDHSVWTFLVGS